MDEDAVEQKFTEWLAVEGDGIASEIHDILKTTSDRLSIDDGSHAVWHEGSLGLLLVLPFEHAMAFSAESIAGDFEASPLHNYVFTTISELIMRASAVMGEAED